jgi:hypothetical protein
MTRANTINCSIGILATFEFLKCLENVKQFRQQCIKGLKWFCHFFQVINLDLKYIVWLSGRQVSTMGFEFPELPHVMLLVLIWSKDLVEFWMAVIPFEKQRRHLTCFLDWFWYVTLVFWYITNPIFGETWLNTRIKSLRMMIRNMKEGS